MEVSKTQGIFGPPQADFLGNSLVKTHFPALIETVPRFEERSKNRKKIRLRRAKLSKHHNSL